MTKTKHRGRPVGCTKAVREKSSQAELASIEVMAIVRHQFPINVASLYDHEERALQSRIRSAIEKRL
jgi:hypothetical protein